VLQRGVQRPWLSAAGVRRGWELSARVVPLPARTSLVPGRLGGVPAVRFEGPDPHRDRAILYLHGGAWVSGSPVTHRRLTAALCHAAGAPVHSVDYRLAPEHTHPAALDDGIEAYRALLDSGLDASRVAIAGDSAGAAIALTTAIRLRDAGEPLPAAIALLCPSRAQTHSLAALRVNARRDAGLNPDWAVPATASYRAGADPLHPELSPLFADHSGLPPIHLQGGGHDVLVNDADRLAARAREAGVEVDYRRYEGLWHDFQLASGRLREADEAIREVALFFERTWLASEAPAPA